jgi:hypothetical protein
MIASLSKATSGLSLLEDATQILKVEHEHAATLLSATGDSHATTFDAFRFCPRWRGREPAFVDRRGDRVLCDRSSGGAVFRELRRGRQQHGADECDRDASARHRIRYSLKARAWRQNLQRCMGRRSVVLEVFPIQHLQHPVA